MASYDVAGGVCRPCLQRRLDSVTGEYREYKCGMEAGAYTRTPFSSTQALFVGLHSSTFRLDVSTFCWMWS